MLKFVILFFCLIINVLHAQYCGTNGKDCGTCCSTVMSRDVLKCFWEVPSSFPSKSMSHCDLKDIYEIKFKTQCVNVFDLQLLRTLFPNLNTLIWSENRCRNCVMIPENVNLINRKRCNGTTTRIKPQPTTKNYPTTSTTAYTTSTQPQPTTRYTTGTTTYTTSTTTYTTGTQQQPTTAYTTGTQPQPTTTKKYRATSTLPQTTTITGATTTPTVTELMTTSTTPKPTKVVTSPTESVTTTTKPSRNGTSDAPNVVLGFLKENWIVMLGTFTGFGALSLKIWACYKCCCSPGLRSLWVTWREYLLSVWFWILNHCLCCFRRNRTSESLGSAIFNEGFRQSAWYDILSSRIVFLNRADSKNCIYEPLTYSSITHEESDDIPMSVLAPTPPDFYRLTQQPSETSLSEQMETVSIIREATKEKTVNLHTFKPDYYGGENNEGKIINFSTPKNKPELLKFPSPPDDWLHSAPSCSANVPATQLDADTILTITNEMADVYNSTIEGEQYRDLISSSEFVM